MTSILRNEKFPKNVLILLSWPRSTYFYLPFWSKCFYEKAALFQPSLVPFRKIETKHKRNSWIKTESKKKGRKYARQERRNNSSTIETLQMQFIQKFYIKFKKEEG